MTMSSLALRGLVMATIVVVLFAPVGRAVQPLDDGAVHEAISVEVHTLAVERVLDDWHAAAAAADAERYFGHFASDGIFLGTDAGERWTLPEFRAYAMPYFLEGRGWTYVPSNRHVMFSSDGNLAWFDEALTSEKYGQLRGTGVLRRSDEDWKLVQYNMTFAVPNGVTGDVVSLIRKASGGSSSAE
jgi:ketosteroid isomerase-like protein